MVQSTLLRSCQTSQLTKTLLLGKQQLTNTTPYATSFRRRFFRVSPRCETLSDIQLHLNLFITRFVITRIRVGPQMAI